MYVCMPTSVSGCCDAAAVVPSRSNKFILNLLYRVYDAQVYCYDVYNIYMRVHVCTTQTNGPKVARAFGPRGDGEKLSSSSELENEKKNRCSLLLYTRLIYQWLLLFYCYIHRTSRASLQSLIKYFYIAASEVRIVQHTDRLWNLSASNLNFLPGP